MNRKFKYSPIGRFIRRISIGLKKLYRSTSSPHQIAFGFAFGAFVGIFPTFGFGLLICSGLGLIFKFNVPASMLGSLIGAPWMTPLWIASSVALGKVFTKSSTAIFQAEGLKSFLSEALDLGIDYIIGNTIISVVLSSALYFLVKWLVIRYRTNKERKKQESQT